MLELNNNNQSSATPLSKVASAAAGDSWWWAAGVAASNAEPFQDRERANTHTQGETEGKGRATNDNMENNMENKYINKDLPGRTIREDCQPELRTKPISAGSLDQGLDPGSLNQWH